MNSNIPSDVKEAIHKLSEFAGQSGYVEVTVSRTGSASFTQHSQREKTENFGATGILALIAAAILFISSLVIIGIHLFQPLPQLNDSGWMLILIGSSVLSAMVTLGPAIGKRETRDTNIVMATFATFLFFGLARLSTHSVLSTLFYCMAFSSFVFGSGFNSLQKGFSQVQQVTKSKNQVL